MAVLTGDYQYIGRSNAVSCSAGWNYYILLYAKTSGSIATGKHTVTVLMRLACTSDATFYGYGTAGSVTVAGIPAISWSGSALPGTDWSASAPLSEGGVYYYRHTDIAEGTAVVDTGWGAAKDITISTSWGRVESVTTVPAWLPYYKTYATANITVTLPMIAGASTINWAGDVILGNACSVNWTPISGLFYRLRFFLNDWSQTTGVIAPGTIPYTYTGFAVPLDVAWQLPSSPVGAMAVTLYTYSDAGGTVQIGSEHTAYFTVTVPDNASTKPSVGFAEVVPVSALAAPFSNLYIKGKSRVKVTLSPGVQYGASIVELYFTVDGKSYGSEATSDYLSNAGNLTINAVTKDSRGFYGSNSISIPVHDYAKPTIQVGVCARSDAAGNVSDTGTSLRIEAQRTFFSVGGYNSCRMWYQWKLAIAADSGFSEAVTLTNNASYSGVITDVEFNKQASYVIRLGVTDGVGETATAAFTILTEKIYWHRGNDFLALGMYSQSGGLECGWPARFYDQIYIGDVTLESYIKNLISGGG